MIPNPDGGNGSCSSTPYGYSGSLAPLNEEISIHIRGPLKLSRFAAYTPGGSTSKKAKRAANNHPHGHAHDRLHNKRQADDIVVQTMNGQVVSWVNDYNPGAAAEATTATVAAPSPYDTPSAYNAPAPSSESSTSSSGSNSSDTSTDSNSQSEGGVINPGGSDSWGRHAFYDGDSSEGLVFLNHKGGSGSGVYDYSFGNSLSYAGSDGVACAKEPTKLAKGTTIPGNGEIVIMSDDECDGDDCGYVRDDSVAYHGFDGDDKAFFFEFQMPDDGQDTDDLYTAVNMPVIWTLNAQIPRTLQYGQADCSCWESGCGEFDIFEVLAPGETRMKSAMHGNRQGAMEDYYERPIDTLVKGAMIMTNNEIHVKLLSTDFDFPTTMSKSDLTSILESKTTNPSATFNQYTS